MATVVPQVTTADTASTPNTSGTFTPPAGSLLVVLSQISNTIVDGTVVSSDTPTFTQLTRSPYSAAGHMIYAHIANAFANAVLQSVTLDSPTDAGTGTIIGVAAVSGMLRTGLSAVKQFKILSNQGAATPVLTFDTACLTENPTLGVVGNLLQPAAMTEPTNWTEGGDDGYLTPTCGLEWVYRDSGFTGTTITWGSAASTEWGAIILELDTSVNNPLVLMGQAVF